MGRYRLAVAALLLFANAATAEPWYKGSAGRRRAVHIAAIGVGGAVYLSSETFLKDDLAPRTCRVCSPNGLDRSVRNAVVWSDTAPAITLSNLSAFVVTPALALSLVALSSNGVDSRVAQILDDTFPVVESGLLAALLNQSVKFAVGRRRPFVEFGDRTRPSALDDNVSFYSGHTTFTFALATSAGVVAHRRGYRLEPIIWAGGYAASIATGYLRMAADRHYLSDVVVGALAGTAIGIVVPIALDNNVRIVPARDGVAVAGRF